MSVPPEVEELIAGAQVSAHVATSVDDRPHVAPVWYEYDDGTIRFTTGGKKLRNIEANPRVAVSIERAEGPDVDWSATLLGVATVTDDPQAVRDASRRIGEKYGTAADGDALADGGEKEVADEAGRLVEVDVGSAVAQRY